MFNEISELKGQGRTFASTPHHPIESIPFPNTNGTTTTQLLKWNSSDDILQSSLCLTSLLPAPSQSQSPLRLSLWHVSRLSSLPISTSHPSLFPGWILCCCCWVARLGLTLGDMNGSLPGSSVHEIYQARILEWVHISFSRGSSQLRDETWVSWFQTGWQVICCWATRKAQVNVRAFYCFSTSFPPHPPTSTFKSWSYDPPTKNQLVASLWTSRKFTFLPRLTNLLWSGPGYFFYPSSQHSASPGAWSTHTGLSSILWAH